MSPLLIVDDDRDLRFADSIRFSKLFIGASLLMKMAHFFNITCGQFCHAVRFAFDKAVFGNGVVNVLFLSTKKEMIGVDAGRIVAFVKDLFSNWNGTIMKLPRKTMREQQNLFSILVGHFNATIFSYLISCPQPTRFSFRNLRPKSVFDWFRFSHWFQLYDFVEAL